jgi:MSHA pilin protein MshA
VNKVLRLHGEEKQVNKQNGFTLVELVAVIVLLGSLAVAALPRFIDLRGDARASTLEAIVGSTRSAAVQVYAKSLIQNQIVPAQTVVDGPLTIATEFGYPTANSPYPSADPDISDLVNVDGDASIKWHPKNGGETYVGFDLDSDDNVVDDSCYVTYTESAVVGTLATIVITDNNSC